MKVTIWFNIGNKGRYAYLTGIMTPFVVNSPYDKNAYVECKRYKVEVEVPEPEEFNGEAPSSVGPVEEVKE